MQRLEEARRHVAQAGLGPRPGIVRLARHDHRPDPAPHGHGKEADVRRARDPRQCADLGEHAIVEALAHRRGPIARQGQGGAQGQDTVGAESRIHRPHPPQRPQQQAATDEQHDGGRHLRHHQDRTRSLAAAADPRPGSFVQPGHTRLPAAAQCRHDAEPDADGGGQQQREAQDAQVHRRHLRDGERMRHQPRQHGHGHRGDGQAQRAAGQGEEQALGEELADETLAAGSQGRPHGQLLPTRHGPREQQARQVGARDQQQAGGRAQQREGQHPRLDGQLVAQPVDRRAGLRVRVGIRALQLRGDHLHLGASLLERDVPGQPRHDVQVVVCAVREVRLPEPFRRRPHLGVAVREAEPGRHHAHHDVWRAVDQDLAAEHAGFAPEARLPNSMAQHHGGHRLGSVVLGTEDTSQLRPHAQQRKHLRGEVGVVHALRLAFATEIDRPEAEGPHRLERPAHALPVAVVRRGQLRVPIARFGFPEPHQAVRLRERQRAEQHVVGDREGGRGRAHPQRGHHDRGERETGRAAERASCVREVLAQDVEVRARGAHDDVDQGLDPERDRGHDPDGLAPALGMDGGHLAPVLGAERGRIEMEERAVEAHQAFPGAKPLARASRTSSVSRRASARATAVPNGVIR